MDGGRSNSQHAHSKLRATYIDYQIIYNPSTFSSVTLCGLYLRWLGLWHAMSMVVVVVAFVVSVANWVVLDIEQSLSLFWRNTLAKFQKDPRTLS